MSDKSAREAVGDYRYGFHDPENSTIRFDKGLSEQVVRDISELKNEPKWMTDIRVKAYRRFMEMPMPSWGNSDMLNQIDFEAVTYFLRSSKGTEKDWDEGVNKATDKYYGSKYDKAKTDACHSFVEALIPNGAERVKKVIQTLY